jgi:hypothetical protein
MTPCQDGARRSDEKFRSCRSRSHRAAAMVPPRPQLPTVSYPDSAVTVVVPHLPSRTLDWAGAFVPTRGFHAIPGWDTLRPPLLTGVMVQSGTGNPAAADCTPLNPAPQAG